MSVPLKKALPRVEIVDLNALSSVDEDSVNKADTRSVKSVGDSGCLKREPQSTTAMFRDSNLSVQVTRQVQIRSQFCNERSWNLV